MRKNFIFNIFIVLILLIALAININRRINEKSFSQPSEAIHTSFNTKDIAPDIKGFGGHIEMFVKTDKDGNITDVSVLLHNETPEYASLINSPDFLDQFKGKNTDDDFIVGKDVHALTHATISSKAVAKTLKTCLERIKGQKKSPDIHKKKIEFYPNAESYITMLIVFFLAVSFFLKKKGLINIGMLASLIYFGFFRAMFISASGLGKIFLWQVPDMSSGKNWYLFIFSGIILTILLGKFYCFCMCPFGALQVFINKIFRYNLKISADLAKKLRRIRYIFLWFFIILILIFNNPNIADYEPFSTVFLWKGDIVAWFILFIVLLLSLFYYRPFCSFFCVAGAFLDILSNLRKMIFKKHGKG